jgi:hypothetical protein
MKLIVAVTGCLLFAGVALGQTTTRATASGGAKIRKNAIGGTIKDIRRRPVAKIQAYIYRNDTIAASGYTNAEGNYETNSVMPGVYSLRLVYPSSKRITVTNVPVKQLKITMVNITTAEPVEDSTIAYTDLVPPAPKKP